MQTVAPKLLARREWHRASCLPGQRRAHSGNISTSFAQTRLAARSVAAIRQPHGVNGQRAFHVSCKCADESSEWSRQAVPLGDFYTELLSSPLVRKAQADSDLPDFVHLKDESKLERARKLFGSIEGSGYERRTSDTPDATWRTINGVPIPPRPLEPENCCMSGCVHCVWDDYRDDVESWAARIAEAQAKSPTRRSRGGTPKIDMPRPEVRSASNSMDDDGGGSETLWTTPSTAATAEEELFQGIPIGIRAFMATEKRIRERKLSRRSDSRVEADDYP